MPLVDFVQYVAAAAILGLLLYICVDDFNRLIIENWAVVILLGLYLIWSGVQGFPQLWTDLFIGAMFFMIAFLMWIFRAMGAGDVKLYFVLGLLLGMQWAALFVPFLLLVSVLFWVGLRLTPPRDHRHGYILRRINDLKADGVVPYGVVLSLAALPPLIGRLFS